MTNKRGTKPTPVKPGTLGAKVRKARELAGWNTRQLGEKVGVSNVTITHIETNQTNPTERTLRLLAQELKDDLGLPWLQPYISTATLGEGEIPVYFGAEEHRIISSLAKQQGRTFAEEARELALEALISRGLVTDRVDTNVVFLADRVPRMVRMRLWGDIAAGELKEAVAQDDKVDIPETFIKPGRDQFVLRARGESMIDEGIHDGSLIVCDATSTAKNGDMVVALIDGEQATVKKFYKEKTRIRLQPANKLLKPIYVNPARLKIQGVVVGIIRHRP